MHGGFPVWPFERLRNGQLFESFLGHYMGFGADMHDCRFVRQNMAISYFGDVCHRNMCGVYGRICQRKKEITKLRYDGKSK